MGNRGKLAKALQTPASVLLETIPFHSSRAIGLGMREGRMLRRLSRPHEGATWLILPVVICLSQRLSHACLSVNNSYETANGSLNQLSNT